MRSGNLGPVTESSSAHAGHPCRRSVAGRHQTSTVWSPTLFYWADPQIV